jgi:hypothetical protein
MYSSISHVSKVWFDNNLIGFAFWFLRRKKKSQKASKNLSVNKQLQM